ncbi:hypothetical protein G3O08_16165 [Cryomorpha ignava]|uniref:DUF2281 domain-containing protein n=1 Tax=Cryomorpha ignava TaxID=101383 RepID=A0A7K3WU71_9FLAO|nr:hypothetical protein [Cryomorpha ignava]NEN25036.1 hypothetical protein [Cryomorpha ignava]
MDNQIRTEISQLIQKLPENQLESILEYLRQVEKTSAEQVETANFVKKIFEEDAELLKRLAR